MNSIISFSRNYKKLLFRVVVLLLILENAALPDGTVLLGITGKNDALPAGTILPGKTGKNVALQLGLFYLENR